LYWFLSFFLFLFFFSWYLDCWNQWCGALACRMMTERRSLFILLFLHFFIYQFNQRQMSSYMPIWRLTTMFVFWEMNLLLFSFAVGYIIEKCAFLYSKAKKLNATRSLNW
jgi:hypothetical protein